MKPENKIRIEIVSDWDGLRLDKALGLHSEIRTRSRAEQLIQQGRVTLAGKALKSSAKVSAGMILDVVLPEPSSSELIPLEKKLDIVFEDQDLIVINKPAGLVVHPAAGHEQDTLVNMLLAHTPDLSMGFHEQRPGIVHRLDRDTSGLLVVAKNNIAHQALSEKFQKRDLHRIYHAVCVGAPKPAKGTIQSFLARHPNDRKRYASILGEQKKPLVDLKNPPSQGKWAVTHYEILDQSVAGLSYLKLKLETGRTHQIRVHLSEFGCPILHDETYGALKKEKSIQSKEIKSVFEKFPRFALHARELGFHHPRTGEWLFFKSNWPEDVLPLIQQLKFSKLNAILES